MLLADLPVACGLCSCGTAELESCKSTTAVGRYNEPIQETVKSSVELLAPIGAQHLRTDTNESDRFQVVEWWRFWIIPPVDIKHFDKISYLGCCYEVVSIEPAFTQCCGKKKLHHVKVTGRSVRG